MSMLLDNLKDVEERIQAACDRSGRKREDVLLVAVSKTKPVEMIEEVMTAGIVDFGENKPQELRDKYEVLPQNLRFHMIGHLQRNKVKYLIGKVTMIHSVDSLRLAEEISKESVKKDAQTDILLEINCAGEESKFGIRPKDTLALVRQIAVLPNVHIRGLMTVAPLTQTPEENRVYFQLMKKLSVDIAQESVDNVSMDVLSMGMTIDYQTAIEEGSTCVRVGTGIFGTRTVADME